VPNIWISGASSVGKTAVVTSVLKSSALPFSFSNCQETFNGRLLFEDILAQFNHKEPCSSLSEFVRTLKALLPLDETFYFVIDNAHLLRADQLTEFSLVLPSLLSMSDLVS
jgi:Cdc6-like AAA superfamily ATPase